MKRFGILLLVVGILAGIAVPVLAVGPRPPKRMPFSLVGRITAVDTEAATVTVEVVRGNRPVKPFIGTMVTIQTDAATRLLKKTETGVVPIGLTDLQVGNTVSIRGSQVNGGWIAIRVMVRANPP